MSVTLNGIAVAFKPGINIKDKLTEDLDTGFIILPQTTALVVEPYKSKIVIVEGATKNMLVSDIKRVTSKFTGTKEYNYELGLISPTIQLQRIVLPNRSITQPLTGSKTPIFDILDRYVGMYSDFTISAALETLTEDTDCPEFQWNRPTLFEVINDLLSEVDAVVTMSSFTEISYLDLNTAGSTIPDTFAEIELTQNITDYANKIECEVENAIVGARNTRVVEWVAVKTDDDVLLSTDNVKIILEHSIDKINNVVCLHDSNPTVFTDGRSGNITDYILEKTAYDLTLPDNTVGYVTGNVKRNRLYYEYGGNTIEGLAYTDATWAGITVLTNRAALNVLHNAYLADSGVSHLFVNSDIRNLYMQVDYQTQDTVKIISNKTTAYTTLTTETPVTLINNQDTSYVDFRSFARKQQQTVNRLGNETLTLMGKFANYAAMPSLGDNFDTDYKLAMRDYVIYDNSVNFKGTCSKDYVLKDLFTGLKTARRFTPIAKTNEALESNHIQELYFNLSKQGDVVSINSDTLDTTLENYIFRFAETDENIKMIHFKTDEGVEIGVTPSVYYTTKSIILSWRMADNFSAGLQLDDTTALLHNYVPYVNTTTGRFNSYVYKLYKGYDFTSEAPQVTYPSHKIRMLPEIDTTLLAAGDLVYTSGTIYRYKDNREITLETLQYNFAHESNVFYGNKFFEDSPITFTGSADTTLYVAYSTTLTYSDGDQTKKGTIAAATALTYTKTNNDITITSPDSSIVVADLASWAVCDAAGNIYIAANN